jgi:uncharacterized cupredoxin-like copper-binding protein
MVAAAFAAFAQPALSHGDVKHDKKANRPISTEEKPFWREGDLKRVSRTIDVDMSDQMRFSPGELAVKQGETVRFRVRTPAR